MAENTSTEKYRHECEVRWVLRMANMRRMADYMNMVEKARGKPAADRLRADVRVEIERARNEQI